MMRADETLAIFNRVKERRLPAGVMGGFLSVPGSVNKPVV